MVAIVDFTKDGAGGLHKHETFYKKFIAKDRSGTLYNFTGFTAKMQVRQNFEKPVIIELSTINSRITLGGTSGTIEMSIPKEITSTLQEGKYIYDLFVTSSIGKTFKIFEGIFTIYPSVTT